MNYYNSETLLEQQQEIQKLKDERDELTAQVEALKAAIDGVRKVGKTSGFGVPSPASVRAERLAWLRMAEVVELSPQHHLRQVRSDAGRDGFVAGYHKMHIEFVGSLAPKESAEFAADKYHASILAGKE